MTDLLDDETIMSRLVKPTASYSYIQPFASAADSLIEVVTNIEGRWMFGIPEIDQLVRGLGNGELMYVTGVSHSGKTQVILQGLANNPDARVIFFTPDEVDSLILTKLVGITNGISGEDLEHRIKLGDEQALEVVRRVASETFKNLIVVDDALTFEQMSVAVAEAEDMWGAPAQLVIIDFLELLPGDGEGSEGVAWKSQELKRWTKVCNVPTLCIHQASRTSGKRGQGRGMEGMRYGGENDAIFVLEVYRKADDKDLEEIERDRLRDTVTVDVVKNKRPPCKKGSNDLYLDPDCGAVRSLRPSDLVIHRKGADRVLDMGGTAQ